MPATHPPKGTRVTPLRSTKPFYFGYGPTPKTLIDPGDICVVTATNIPPVTGNRGDYFTATVTKNSHQFTLALRSGEFQTV